MSHSDRVVPTTTLPQDRLFAARPEARARATYARHGVGLLVVALQLASTLPASAGAQEYVVTPLGVLSGRAESIAWGINDAGQVVGESYNWFFVDGSGRTVNNEAFITGADGGGLRGLGFLPGGVESRAFDVNRQGRVVGTGLLASGVWEAFITGPDGAGGLTGLGFLPPGTDSYANAINTSGRVVGVAPPMAFITGPNGTGGLTPLAVPAGGNAATASGINDAGQVVGSIRTADREIGFITGPGGSGAPTSLPLFPGQDGAPVAFTVPQDLDAAGRVIGYATRPIGTYEPGFVSVEAFITGPNGSGGLTGLGFLSEGQAFSYAFGMNDSGLVVGRGSTGGFVVDVVRGGGLRSLSALVADGWTIFDAQDVNARGQIAANGFHPAVAGGARQALLLTPTSLNAVPEPSTLVLVTAGLLLCAGVARARRACFERRPRRRPDD